VDTAAAAAWQHHVHRRCGRVEALVEDDGGQWRDGCVELERRRRRVRRSSVRPQVLLSSASHRPHNVRLHCTHWPPPSWSWRRRGMSWPWPTSLTLAPTSSW